MNSGRSQQLVLIIMLTVFAIRARLKKKREGEIETEDDQVTKSLMAPESTDDGSHTDDQLISPHTSFKLTTEYSVQ